MVIDMDKLKRVHYLKHYLGRSAIVLDEHTQVHGEIENVDIEDDSVLIKSGERSTWFDADRVSPALKKFRDLTHEDIETIFRHTKFRGAYPILSEMKLVRCGDLVGYYSEDVSYYISQDWSVWKSTGPLNFIQPDNIGTIILLLCEMGFDVTGNAF